MIEVIQPFLAPAVMFSAGGLLCLAQFARFTAVLGLLRSFNHERLGLLEKLGSGNQASAELLGKRLEGLEQQARAVLVHANTIRNALRFLVGGILLMVACSLSIGASMAIEAFERLALGLFILGLLSTFSGLCLVLAELRESMTVIELEHRNLERFHRDGGLVSSFDPPAD